MASRIHRSSRSGGQLHTCQILFTSSFEEKSIHISNLLVSQLCYLWTKINNFSTKNNIQTLIPWLCHHYCILFTGLYLNIFYLYIWISFVLIGIILLTCVLPFGSYKLPCTILLYGTCIISRQINNLITVVNPFVTVFPVRPSEKLWAANKEETKHEESLKIDNIPLVDGANANVKAGLACVSLARITEAIGCVRKQKRRMAQFCSAIEHSEKNEIWWKSQICSYKWFLASR